MAGLTVACVNWRDYQGRGQWYVDKLREGAAKHLTVPHTFKVFGDADLPEGVDGWFNKIYLFSNDAFPAGERVLFLDLDSAIIGNIDDMGGYDGPLAMLSDFHFPWTSASGVMLWRAGDYEHIWTDWNAAGRPLMRQGDQHWIRFCEPKAARIQGLWPGAIAGFKTDCKSGVPPPGARIVCWHGHPKPHHPEGKLIHG